ncbi:hypothetical protein [Sulfuritalea sp.]|uniref:hypothetical protein n=1 Tax=Sulfuritalea sp. TaxID=2480090 RepID=UPI00286DDFE8|nr:hypothetical protein [Sulfuritalea sp.]
MKSALQRSQHLRSGAGKGRLMSPHPEHAIDKRIAAIAAIHDLTVVIRNVDDFRGTGARLQNPFM